MDIGQMGGGDALYTRIYQVEMFRCLLTSNIKFIEMFIDQQYHLPGHLFLPRPSLLPLTKVARLRLLHQGWTM